MSSDFLSSVTKNLAIVTFDTKTNITYVSDLFAQTMGYSKEELLKMQHRDLCFSSFVNSASYTEFWKRLLAGQTFQDQVLRKDKGNKKVYLEANYFPLRDEAHNLTGVCKVCFDKTKSTSTLIKSIGEIGQITNTVHEIAYNTNILAVNTALQAVRSSENSNGFSVVAKEMRKLSKDVDQSSKDIRETVQNILHELNVIDQDAY
ncbi:MAG TPA: methyl-accepting chemotaxis protein [Ligilactobacillus acidipiscis]|uniref:Methyl-accepting chemotaxis protein n=1 Tax=Ligilactobacillus acidipiscis TaxID=89059 RepID=A0A921F888_9LACO|nr:methyl-accepting chemotaxis protein [Ligilactobacillus acidipiscis]